jgi:WD40 repeat protein
MRIYNGENGRLQKYLSDFHEMEDPKGFKPDQILKEVDNTAMCFDNRNRKVFVADALGFVRCFNVSSGALISIICTDQTPHNTSLSTEILSLRYYTHKDSQILITCHCNDMLKAWDVSNDKFERIKVASGGHNGDNISVMEMSEWLCVLATGSFNGDVIVWDFETFRNVGHLKGHKSTVTSIQFVNKTPLLISGCAMGIVCVHSIQGAPSRLLNVCLGKFVNLEPYGATHISTGIASMLIFYD